MHSKIIFLKKVFKNNDLFIQNPSSLSSPKDDLSQCLVQDNGGDLGSIGWSWGTMVYPPVAHSWGIPSHSLCFCRSRLFWAFMLQLYKHILCIHSYSKRIQSEAAEPGQLLSFFLFILTVSPFDLKKAELWKYHESRTVQNLDIQNM